MKNLIYFLMALPLLFASCSNDAESADAQTVQVTFSTELPQRLGSRATTTPATVNKVVCAVFEHGQEIKALRKEVAIQAGVAIEYAPQLIKGRTYNVVFWAMKDDSYVVTDLTAITRTPNKPEADYDAFTKSEEITVANAEGKSVTLLRPLAQLNLGVTQADWTSVSDPNGFNMTPTTVDVTITGKETFNALTGLATGQDQPLTRTALPSSGDDLVVNGTTYKSIASCYLYPEAGQENFDVTFTVKDQHGDPIRADVLISSVPLQSNYRTNVVGGLLTGTITYTIDFEEEFTDSHDKEI